MPIYEYRCKKCSNVFELLELFNAKPVKKCEKCGGDAERFISQSSFVLKGSGWYQTDYAKKSDAPQCPKAAGGDTSKTEGGEACNACPASKSQ